jgi:two-component system cell cycle response regulator
MAAPEDDQTLTGISLVPAEEVRPRSAYLFILSGPEATGRMIRLPHQTVVLGRSSDADIHIQDAGMSRHHARISVADGTIRLEDLGSKNGTFVSGERVDSTIVAEGEKIQLGSSTIIKVCWQDALDEAIQQQLYDSATRDGLTGLYNRKFLLETLDKDISFCRRHKVPLSVVMLDVDYFKAINDEHGHLAGDNVLRMVAQLTAQSVRNEDVVTRFGGEEFALVLKDCAAPQAAQLAERLRRKIEAASCEFAGRALQVTVSMGIAALGESAEEAPDHLLHRADQALYRAKAEGRNRVIHQDQAAAG